MLDELARSQLTGVPRTRGRGWVDRVIALLSGGLVERRLRALVLLQLDPTVDRATSRALIVRLRGADVVQWAIEAGGSREVLLMLDCAGADEFAERTETLLGANATVRRYQCFLVGRELKFVPLARLGS